MKKIVRSDSEINEAIEVLKKNKGTCSRYSAFGDDNHADIDAMVKVLERRLTRDDIENWDGPKHSAACSAIDFMEGSNELDDITY